MFYCSQSSRTFLIPIDQRHKLGSNLTPVTPETFTKWKKTRMDKKEAEQEASRKSKEAQNAAGKNVGMSGRDLVSWKIIYPANVSYFLPVPIQSRVVPRRGRRRFRRLGSYAIQAAKGTGRPGCRGGADCWFGTVDIHIYNIHRFFI